MPAITLLGYTLGGTRAHECSITIRFLCNQTITLLGYTLGGSPMSVV